MHPDRGVGQTARTGQQTGRWTGSRRTPHGRRSPEAGHAEVIPERAIRARSEGVGIASARRLLGHIHATVSTDRLLGDPGHAA